MPGKPLALVAAGCLAILLIAAALVDRETAPDVRVSYGEVTTGPIVREVMTTGTLEPATSVDAGAQVSGTVQSIGADFNTPVRAGQVIATLDPSTYDTRVTEARAKWIQAQAEAERTALVAGDTEIKRQRAEDLASRDLINEAERDAARAAARQAEAERVAAAATVKVAQAEHEEARILRDRTIIRSPIDGIVVNRSVEVGQTLASRFESPVLFSIANLQRMRLLAEIDEADVGGVTKGTPVTFTVESLGNQRFEGAVVEVRLQPMVQQPNAVGTSGSSSSSAPSSSRTPLSTSGATSSAPSSATSGQASSTPTPSSSGTAPSPTFSSSTSASSAQAAPAPAVPAGSVISYTAIVEVDNSDGRLAPGSTAVLNVPAAKRGKAVRIPNRALAFRPPQDVLERLGDGDLVSRSGKEADEDPAKGRAAQVWKFEGGRFVPIAVRVGLSDESWTELVSGDLREGDRLVTDLMTP